MGKEVKSIESDPIDNPIDTIDTIDTIDNQQLNPLFKTWIINGRIIR